MDSSNSQEIFDEIKKIPSESLRAKLLFVNKLTEDRAKFQEDTFDAEFLNLKKKFDDDYQTLAIEISKIVSGDKIPELSEEESKKYEIKSGATQSEAGIPQYWATVLTNSKDFYQVNENDEKILKFLKDVRVAYFDDKLSYSIEFVFAPNEFFTNEKLTKTYIFDQKDHECKKIEGFKINWTSDDKIPNKIKTVKNIRSNINFE
jgi:nucleosome assembly protein 1-like 1